MRFKQSVSDFPMTVTLGKEAPSWELSRRDSNSRLRFVPLDNEGYTLRGDRRRLVYKGRLRSHRISILGDSAFEYDCILEREPESNVVTLLLEGAENYDFFRQPDFVSNPFLKGSYAVYKKETLIGEGTGKLCHIHRPLIIDTRGRRCWGDLAIAGNELKITIPEKWLGKATYPVIVDPTIGTTTLGSQLDTKSFQKRLLLTKYSVPEKVTGVCTAYVYIAYPELYGNIAAALYSDNNDLPYLRKSKNEQVLSLVPWANDPPYWASLSFEVNGTLSKNSFCWFGVNVIAFMTRYDFMDGITHEIPVASYNVNPAEIKPAMDIYYKHNKRYSWYFSFESSPAGEDYFCILTGNIKLSDTKKQTVEYKRKELDIVQSIEKFIPSFFFRHLITEIGAFIDKAGQCKEFIRRLAGEVNGITVIEKNAIYHRREQDLLQAKGTVFRGLLLFIKIKTQAFVRDYLLRRFLIARDEIVLKSRISREITFDSKIK